MVQKEPRTVNFPRIIVGPGRWPVAGGPWLSVSSLSLLLQVSRPGALLGSDVAPSGRLPRGFLQDRPWRVLVRAVLQWRGEAGKQHE